jgi:hypothetical protein
MKALTPYFGWLVSALLMGCAMDIEADEEENASADYAAHGGIPDQDPGAPETCGADFMMSPDGELLQVPVLCDMKAEALPGTGPEELLQHHFLLDQIQPVNEY